jgi:hypothetical protein
MTQHFANESTLNSTDAQDKCLFWLSILQITIGVLLVTTSVFVYSLMHHHALTIPAMMGTALIVHSAKAFLVCRDRPLFGDHHQPNNGMTG